MYSRVGGGVLVFGGRGLVAMHLSCACLGKPVGLRDDCCTRAAESAYTRVRSRSNPCAPRCMNCTSLSIAQPVKMAAVDAAVRCRQPEKAGAGGI